MAVTNNVGELCERAVVTWLQAKSLGDVPTANVFRGFSTSVKVLPAVHVRCLWLEPVVTRSGTYLARMQAFVRSGGEDSTEDQHQSRANTILDYLDADDVASGLSAQLADFFVQDSWSTARGSGIDERCWLSNLEFTLVASGNDLT